MNFGVSSMIAPLKKVALMKPGKSLFNADLSHHITSFIHRSIQTNHCYRKTSTN